MDMGELQKVWGDGKCLQ